MGITEKELEKENIIVNLRLLLFSVLVTSIIMMDYSVTDTEEVQQFIGTASGFKGFVAEFVLSFAQFDTQQVFIAFFVFILLRYSLSNGKARTEEKVIGVLMALTCLFGRAFKDFGTTSFLVESIAQSVKVIVILTGYIFVFVTLIKCINRFAESNLKIVEVRDINDSIKYRRIMFVMFLAVWSIHIIAYYPGLFTGDTEDIIYMAYNYHTGLADVVNLLSPEVFITDHHSVFFTLILGAFVKAARALNGNENTGIFAYSLVQMVAMSWVLAYGLYKLKNSGVPALIRHIAFVFLLLFSWIPRYAITAAKDTPFAIFLLLYLITIMDIVKSDEDKIVAVNMIKLIIYSVVMFLFRKNGLYVTLLSIPFLYMINKKWIKQIVIVIVCLMLTKTVYSDGILPMAKIPDGSISAALTVPLQQTSRYLVHFSDEVTEEEKAAINGVLPYDSIASMYWADRSDSIKGVWRKEADSEDIKNYFIAWGKMFCKHPMTYVAATANNCYGYFYPVVLDLQNFIEKSHGGMHSCNKEELFDFRHAENKISSLLCDVLKIFDNILMRMPILNIVCTSAFYVWLLILGFTKSIVKKDKNLKMLVIPMLMLMLTILTGPCNGNIYHRFTFPIAMCIPYILAYSYRGEGKGETSEQSLCK